MSNGCAAQEVCAHSTEATRSREREQHATAASHLLSGRAGARAADCQGTTEAVATAATAVTTVTAATTAEAAALQQCACDQHQHLLASITINTARKATDLPAWQLHHHIGGWKTH